MQITQTAGEVRISYTGGDLKRARTQVPTDHFSGPAFDRDTGVGTAEVVLLLSTPRSGSTFVCDLLRARAGFVTHEYFGLRANLPYLAERWGCLDATGTLDNQRYVEALKRLRTADNGMLGINVHGFQLPVFERFLPLLAGARLHVVRLRREDRIAQAVSASIATQTQRWTAHHTERREARYDQRMITAHLVRTARQEAIIEAFLARHDLDFIDVTYEAIAADPDRLVPTLLPRVTLAPANRDHTVSRQRDSRNAEWQDRYQAECLALRAGSATSAILATEDPIAGSPWVARARRLRRRSRAGLRHVLRR